MEITHTCIHCGTSWTAPRKSGNRPKYCADCRVLARRQSRDKWIAANPEANKQAQEKYLSVQENRELRRLAQIRWAKENRQYRKVYKAAWAAENRERRNTQAKDRRSKEDEYARRRRAEIKRRSNIRKYGIELEDYEALLAEQSGCCAICGGSDPRTRSGVWPIDHDHNTGKVRGLLCSPCNIALGGFQDDPQILKSAISYLNEAAA